MKQVAFILLSLWMMLSAEAQDIRVIIKEAETFDQQLKEPEALEKYKAALLVESNHLKALVRSAELHVSIGAREKDEKSKKRYYETALAYAKRASDAHPQEADAWYAMSMASGRMTDVEPERKKIVAFVKDTKVFADKAISLNPNHGKAHYTLGKWHYEMVNLSGFKKAAVKLFYGGLPEGTLDKAIEHMELCRKFEPYFVVNYYDLAVAYQQKNRPSQAIEVLNKMVRLPNRSFDDPALKAEGKKLLESIQ